MKKLIYILFVFLLIVSCQKAIEFDLPDVEQTLVIEATVESGLPPRIILTNSQGYFDPIDSLSLLTLFVPDAQVTLFDGDTTFILDYSFVFNNGLFLPGYTTNDPNAIGQFGKEAMGCQNLRLVASDSVISILQKRNLMHPFVIADYTSEGKPNLEQGGVRFDFIPVPHRDDTSDTHAILISGEKKRVLFLPDHDDWEQTLESVGYSNPNDWFQALGATHVLLDATFWNGDELSGRDMTEVPHPTVEDTLERVRNGALGGPEIILIHLNHTNPLNNPDSPQSRLIGVAGHSIGRRGWRIDL